MINPETLARIYKNLRQTLNMPDRVDVTGMSAQIAGSTSVDTEVLLCNSDFYVLDVKAGTITTRDTLNGAYHIFDLEGIPTSTAPARDIS